MSQACAISPVAIGTRSYAGGPYGENARKLRGDGRGGILYSLLATLRVLPYRRPEGLRLPQSNTEEYVEAGLQPRLG